jgi:uncharacterized membrane protein
MDGEVMRKVRKSASLVFSSGVRVSAALIALGLVMAFVTGDTTNPYGVPEISRILSGDIPMTPSLILFLGFTVLVATPVLNVASAAFLFFRGRDNSLALITTFVLLVLIVSLTLNTGK